MNKLSINFENVLTVKEDLNISLYDALITLKNYGISALDVSYDRFLKDDSLISTIITAGYTIQSVFYMGNLGDKGNYSKELEIIDFCIENRIYNIMLLTQPLYKSNADNSEYLFNIKQNLRHIVNYAKTFNIKIGIENFGLSDSPFATIDLVLDFLKSVKGLYCVFDTGNFYFAGENPLTAYKLIKDRISRIHLKDRGLYKGDNRLQKTSITNEITCVYPLGEGDSLIGEILTEIFNENKVFEYALEFDFTSSNILEDIEKSAVYYYSEMDKNVKND